MARVAAFLDFFGSHSSALRYLRRTLNARGIRHGSLHYAKWAVVCLSPVVCLVWMIRRLKFN